MTTREAKAEARKRIRALLRSLDTERARVLSSGATSVFRSLPEYAEADIVLAFLSMPGEIQTDLLVGACLEEGRRVAVPRIEGEDIAFVDVDDAYRHWPRDAMGIPEPPARKPSLSLEDLGGLRVLVAAPGLAFDRRGNRLGRGKGYYDRFLGAARAATVRGGGRLTVCGFCFSLQLTESLPVDERDVPVDAVATEAGLARPLRRE
jgi:5-formyltetrahydrofolate cyclo-ligase